MTLKLFPFILFLHTFLLELCNGAVISNCIAYERNALLNFKKNLIYPDSILQHNRLASWKHEDCCNWEGVSCNNVTGHVVRLDLRAPTDFYYNYYSNGSPLRSKLSPSLFDLNQLNYLDLSMNNFDGPIPKSVGSLHNLTYLNLSLAGFSGLIPPHLGNLTRLKYLDLNQGGDRFGNEFIVSHDARWVSGLTSLKHLTMTRTKFDNFQNWMEALNMLPNIAEICLSFCTIHAFPVFLPNVNFTNLSYLDLSKNSIQLESIPLWLFTIKSLKHIDLSTNIFRSIPHALKNLTSLEHINFSYNDFGGTLPQALKSLNESLENLDLRDSGFNGSLPDWFGELYKLKTLNLQQNALSGCIPESFRWPVALQALDLSMNSLYGTVPKSIGQLSNLVRLNLKNNFLEGVVSEVHFASLTKLKEFRLALNNLILNVSGDWIPPFKLNVIDIRSCKVGPKFPAWLQTQANISFLDMFSSGIVDTLPNWFWDVFSYDECTSLDISSNGIAGSLPNLSKLCFSEFHLDNNFFEGPLPQSLNITQVVDISNNSFSGSVRSIINNHAPISIDLSRNNFSGEIPAISLSYVMDINLSWNLLTGELPNCWNLSFSLIFLDFSRNKLTGNIPITLGTLTYLGSLYLGYNNLDGNIPGTLRNCINLLVLDLGMNKLEGMIPTWMGENLTGLRVLALRSNNFIGNVPSNLRKMTSLQVLDLGNNKLSGRIPQSFGNFTAMINSIRSVIVYPSPGTIQLTIKGRDRTYGSWSTQMTIVDLSCNNLSGHIPKELGNLHDLRYLNLSGNHLVGSIPNEIGLMHTLEFLDLSSNGLSGNIPLSMSTMTTLSILNLTYNNLSGKIPSGNQFDTFPNETYIGNLELCGSPLTKSCDSNETTNDEVPDDEVPEDEASLLDYWYVSIAPGFVFGFWIVLGTLKLKKEWKNAYFRYVDYMYDAVYVAIAAKIRTARKGEETTSG